MGSVRRTSCGTNICNLVSFYPLNCKRRGQGNQVDVRLLGIWNVVSPFRLGVLHHLVCDMQLGVVFERIDPPIPNTVTELLLLTPQVLLGKIWLRVRLISGVKGLACLLYTSPSPRD